MFQKSSPIKLCNLSQIFENRFLNLAFCRRKTAICQFQPCKQQQFAAIDDRLITTSGRRAQCPIAHKAETNSHSITKIQAEGYSTTRATFHTIFKIKGQGHKLTSSVRLISLPLLHRETKCYIPMLLKAGGYYARRPHCLLLLLLLLNKKITSGISLRTNC